MISFQNFSFRYEESKDFTLRGIDMTVQTGELMPRRVKSLLSS